MSANRNAIRWTIAAALTALALVHLGAAVYNWLYGGHTWFVLGIKIRLHQWEKPWLWGITYFTAAVIIRPGGFFPAFLFRALFDPWRSRGPSFARPWAVFGAAAGCGLGLYLVRVWHYLFPSLLYSLPFITAVTAILAGVFWAAALATEKALARRDDRYRQGVVQGGSELVLLGLVFWPLSQWEGFFTDPVRPLFSGFALALVLAWAAGLLQRSPVLAGPKRKVVIAGVVLGLGLAMAVAQLRYRARATGPVPRDRVIFITLDTTRADHLSAYGYPRKTSPRIDAVAKNGARFAFAICPMGTTDPSHASMFTGTYPRTHGSVDVSYPITGKVPSLPDYFAARGFTTACVTSRYRLDPTNDLNLPGFMDEYVLHGLIEQTGAPHAFRRAVNWLDQHRNEDVFLWVHFFDPHQKYLPHPGFPTRFTDSKKECDPDRLLSMDETVPPEEIQRCVDLYDGEIAYMDYWVGRLLDYVEQMEPKSERPPLIVLVADHGEVLGEHQDAPIHYGFGHGDVIYHGTAQIPMIISWPGAIRPTVVGGTAEVVDLAPTLVDYLFERSDFAAQGRSLRPAIEGRAAPDNVGVIQRSARDTDGKPSKDEPAGHKVAWRYRFEPLFALYRGHDKLRVFPDGSTAFTNVLVDPKESQDFTPFLPDQAALLNALFEDWKRVTPETKPKQPDLDADQRAVLRALGYIQ